MYKMVLFFNFFTIMFTMPVDMVVFSYNRGMQLYATIESAQKYFKGLNEVYVLYRADNDDFNKPYIDIKNSFGVKLVRQGPNPRADFKPLYLHILKQCESQYVLLAVDDIFVKDFVDLGVCAKMIEKYNAYGFYLRLGKNINYCYSCKFISPVPSVREMEKGVFSWKFNTGKGDWNYPNSVDMTIFRKADVLRDAQLFNFTAPNVYEGCWAGHAVRHTLDRTGLCFEKSKILNVPANLVQHSHNNNPHMKNISPLMLLKKYNDGYKIDIERFFKMENNSPHYEVNYDYIKR